MIWTMEDLARIEAESVHWPVTANGRGYKRACPECGATGYPRGSWTHRHLAHVQCSICAKIVTAHGLKVHQAMHRRSHGWT